MSEPVTTVVGAEVDGDSVDVRLVGGVVDAVGPDLPRTGTRVLDAGGGALLPGLHDHHLHLFALAARRRSIDVTDAGNASAFDEMVHAAHLATPGAGWLRVVGAADHHGALDADRVDRLAPGRPIRIQHRSGAAWLLDTEGARRAGVDAGVWLHRSDDELAAAWSDDDRLDLTETSCELAALGVTGVTDATPFDDVSALATLASARRRGELAQRVVATGAPSLVGSEPPPGIELGPVKVVVGDHHLPAPGELAAWFTAAHRAGRPVAVHCVTRVALVLALVAWKEAGALPGDRIEHGSVIPVELVADLADLGLTVVTQPSFVAARGDDYRRDVDPDDVAHLYRCGSLLDAGIPVGMSTDAPFGPLDPWAAVAAAADRRTASGVALGAAEAIPARRALDGFLSHPSTPGGPPRRVVAGVPADLVLLDRPLDLALAEPSAGHVAATWIGGVSVH